MPKVKEKKCRWNKTNDPCYLAPICMKDKAFEVLNADWKYCPYCGKRIEVTK